MNLNGKVEALIFDMDGTMIDSMPWHARSWVEFVARHGLVLDVSDILARTTGRTGAECMRELFERETGIDLRTLFNKNRAGSLQSIRSFGQFSARVMRGYAAARPDLATTSFGSALNAMNATLIL